MIAPPPEARDLLRLEAFGAIYFHRTACETILVPPPFDRLLAAARHESFLTAFLRDASARREVSEAQLAREVARFQQQGLLDHRFRVRARLVDGRPAAATLSAPLVTHIQLTHACNLSCTHCYFPVSPNARSDEMDTHTVLNLFRELSALGCPVIVLAGGEPLRRPDLYELLDSLNDLHLDATVCTNATLIDAAGAARLRETGVRGFNVSFDGPDEATHDAIRGQGQFRRAVRGTKHLVEAGFDRVKLRVTVTATNIDRLLGIADVARETGVSAVVFKPFEAVAEAAGQQHLEIDRRRYLDALEDLGARWPADAPPAILSDGMPTRPPSFAPLIPTFGCVGGTTSATVMPNGEVLGCAGVPPEEAWNLKDRSFRDCWLDSKEFARWRTLLDNEQCRSCANLSICGGGCRARALDAGRGFHGPDPFAECSLFIAKDEVPPAPAPRFTPLPMAR